MSGSRREQGGVLECADGFDSSPVKHALHEDPVTHKFALIRLPARFAEDDKVPVRPTERWFSTREEALAALADLFNRDEDDGVAIPAAAPATNGRATKDTSKPSS